MSHPHTARLLAGVAERAPHYFSDLTPGAVNAEPVWERSRDQSTIYRIHLTGGQASHDVVAKITADALPSASAGERHPTGQTRVRLVPISERGGKHDYEFRAATAAHARFTSLGDGRFAAIRPLDHFPSLRAIVMEFVEEPTLRDLAPFKRARTRALDIEFESVFGNVGGWLREFHQISGVASGSLRETPDEVAASFDTLCGFLSDTTGGDDLFRVISRVTALRVPDILPERIPLGLGHGDFAARNVFVGLGSRVRVFDMLAGWRLPIYEDLAHFTIALRTAGAQLLRGRRRIEPDHLVRYEQELVRGYFGDTDIPEVDIAVFQLLILLEKWASVLTTRRMSGLRRRVLLTSYGIVAEPHFRRLARNLLTTIQAA